jgi:hypothetical protein
MDKVFKPGDHAVWNTQLLHAQRGTGIANNVEVLRVEGSQVTVKILGTFGEHTTDSSRLTPAKEVFGSERITKNSRVVHQARR